MANPHITVDLLLNNKSGRQIADSIGKSLNKAATEWEGDVKDKTARGIESGLTLAMSSGRSGAAIKKFLETNITDVYSKFHKELNAGNIQAAEKLERVLDKRTRRFEREVKAQVDAFEAMSKRAARTWAEGADSFTDKVGKLQGAMFAGDPSGYVGVARQLGGRVQEAGRGRLEQAARRRKMAEARAAEIRENGGEGAEAKAQAVEKAGQASAGKMAKMGKAIAGIGAALVTIAAVAAAVLALIKLFMDLNDRIVDMNKSILQTGVATDMGIGGRAWEAAYKFRQTMEDMRGDILDASSELDGFRASSEEMFQTLGTLNEYGRGFEKISKNIEAGTTHLKGYGDAAENAIGYAKLMGTTSQDMARMMSAWSNDFGRDMERVYEGLSAIRQEALASGFSMKRFTSTVAEAVSGMGAYAVRIEEVGATLSQLSNIMGEVGAAELTRSLANAFTELSTGDRLRRILTTGGPQMAEIFGQQAQAEAGSIFRDLGAADRTAGRESMFGSPDELLRKLGQMSEKDRAAFMGEMKAEGYEPELIQRLDNLIDTTKAGQGDLAAQVNAMSTMGTAGTLAALTQSQVFDGMRLHEFVSQGTAQRAGAEKMTGMTGKPFELLLDASRGVAADMAQLRKMQETLEKEGRPMSPEEEALYATKFGAIIDEQGNIVSAVYDAAEGQAKKTGTIIEDEQKLMLSQQERFAKIDEENVTEDIKLARKISQQTEKMANVMEANMLLVLNKIYDALHGFWMDALLAWGKEDPGVQGRIGAINRFFSIQADATKKMQENSKAMRDLEKQIELEQDPQKKIMLEKQLETRAVGQERLADLRDRAAAAESVARGMDTTGMTQAQIQAQIDKQLREEGLGGFGVGGTADVSGAYAKGADILTDTTKGRRRLGATIGMIGGPHGMALGGAVGHMMGTSGADPYVEKAAEQGYEAGAGAVLADIREAAGLGAASKQQRDAVLAAATAAEESGKTFEDVLPELVRLAQKQVEQEAEKDPAVDVMKEIEKNTAAITEEEKNLKTGLLSEGKKAGDFILRPGGRPIITDPNDTLMGFKPGGPIAQAGAGGQTSVNVNIYGGDPKKVYNEVMRVMKTLGHA